MTGAAGFIGYHTCRALLEKGADVVGVDNLNDYHSVDLKIARLEQLSPYSNFRFVKADISDQDAFDKAIGRQTFEKMGNPLTAF